MGFPGGASGKKKKKKKKKKGPPANARDIKDMGLIPGLGRSPGGGQGNPLQYFCLENPMDRGAWWATVHEVTKRWIQLKRLSAYCSGGFPGSSLVKNLPANAGDVGSIPALRRSLGEGNGNPLQYSCLGNHMDRGAWWATVHGIANESDTT